MNIEQLPPVDISSHQALEETVNQLRDEISAREIYEKELEQSKINAEKAAESKSVFLANMSHEIRNPLGLILGFTEELIKSSQLTPANRYLIHTIQRNSEMLARLINDILDFSKVEAGKLDFQVAPIHSCQFIDELDVLFKSKCAEKNLLFHKDVLTTLPECLYSDAVRIKQVLMNLVSNGVKHTDSGGLILKISYSEPNALFYFDVIDSGEGIPLQNQSDIFEVFKQLHKDKPGSGLGLPLSRNLARGLEGDVKLMRSRPGEGSWFRLELKNQKSLRTLPVAKIQSPRPTEVQPPDLTGWKILVVDDLIDNVRLLECILRPTKALMDFTTSSKHAIEKINGFKYDLILLDLMMPEMNGFKTLEQLKKSGFSGEVWAVSAHAMTSDITNCLEAGFSQHISKPIQRMDFYQKLQRLVKAIH